MYYYYGFYDYVSVAEQREKAEREILKLRRKGFDPVPIEAFKGKIAKTFWGAKWCDNLESYADMQYRAERGRRYVRAGCICHLEIGRGRVKAKVSGNRLYNVKINVEPLPAGLWKEIRKKCGRDVSSLTEILKGRLSKNVMSIVSEQNTGLFPSREQISFSCSCPDDAYMCKHVAAALYGIGRRLDERPELLFLLRGVDPSDLVNIDFNATAAEDSLASDSLADIFGIDLDMEGLPQNRDIDNSAQGPSDFQTYPDLKQQPENESGPPAASDAAKRTRPKRTASKKQLKKKNSPQSAGLPANPPFNPLRPTAKGIRELRMLARLSQNAMAKELGLSVSSVIRWEHSSDNLTLQAQSIKKLLHFQANLFKR